MNRRAFLSLVASAPLVAALKPWRPEPPRPVDWHIWNVSPQRFVPHSLDVTGLNFHGTVPLRYVGRVTLREGDKVVATSDGRIIVNGVEHQLEKDS